MRFACFGSHCGLWVTGPGADAAIDDARACLQDWHRRFSRFIASSELSRLNADPREVVPVSTTMAVATSGIGRRSWLGADGQPAHHLLDPRASAPPSRASSRPPLAPTAVEAEWRAKAAVLGGPDAAAGWLAHGGVVVLDDGSRLVQDVVPQGGGSLVVANPYPKPARFAPAAIRRRGGAAAPLRRPQPRP